MMAATTNPTKLHAQIPMRGTRRRSPGRSARSRARRSRRAAPPSESSVRSVVSDMRHCLLGVRICSEQSRLVGALERVAEGQLAGGWRERRARAGGQGRSLAAADERADPPGVLGEDRPGAGTDQDADRRAGEPGHQGQGDAEEAELGFVVASPRRASRSWRMPRTRTSRCR